MLGRLGDESAKHGNASHQAPHILDCHGCLYLLDSFDLLGVGFYPSMGYKEPK